MRTILLRTGAAVLGFAAFAFCSSGATAAEVWNGYLGAAGGNPVRESQPASRLATAWTTENSLPSLTGECLTYGSETVFTSLKDPGTSILNTVAIDSEDGQKLWEYGDYEKHSGCPLYQDGKVYVGYQRDEDLRWAVAALDATDGDLIWEHEFPPGTSLETEGSMAYSGAKVLVFTKGSSYLINALNADDGSESWSQHGRSPGSSGGPVVAGGTVVVIKPEDTLFGDRDGLAAYSVAEGTDLEWDTPDADDLLGSAVDGSVLFHRRGAGGNYNTVVAREVPSGDLLWSKSLGALMNTVNLVASGGKVFALHGTSSDWFGSFRVAALEANDGDPAWPQVFAQGYLSTYLMQLGKWLYVGADTNGGRYLLDPENGEVVGNASGFSKGLSSGGYFAYADRQFFQWVQITSGINQGAFALKAFRDVVPPIVTIQSPVQGAYKANDHLLAWSADDGFDSPFDRFEVSLNSGPAQTIPGTQLGLSVSDLPEGPNSITLTAFDQAGNQSSTSRQITVVTSPVPTAALAEIGAPVLSQTQLTLDATGSRDEVLDGQLEKFEWDLDGDGEFEIDGGNQSTIAAEFSQIGTRTVGVRVTNDSGNSDAQFINVDVRRKPLPGAGAVGVSINGAEIFTNDTNVRLRVKWPALATDLAVSNDGGFETSSSFPLPANGFVNWKLDSSGPERLPKTVYVRYYGSGTDTVTYTDDIILDQTAPVIQEASVVNGGASASSLRDLAPEASVSVRRPKARFRIRLKARDSASGVIAVQVAKSRKVKGPVVQTGKRATKVRKVINPRVKYRPKLIRVKDAAGNWSKFRKVK